MDSPFLGTLAYTFGSKLTAISQHRTNPFPPAHLFHHGYQRSAVTPGKFNAIGGLLSYNTTLVTLHSEGNNSTYTYGIKPIEITKVISFSYCLHIVNKTVRTKHAQGFILYLGSFDYTIRALLNPQPPFTTYWATQTSVLFRLVLGDPVITYLGMSRESFLAKKGPILNRGISTNNAAGKKTASPPLLEGGSS